jgi:hypothetical protein
MCGTDQRRDSSTNSIATKELYRRIGIVAQRPAHAKRALKAAAKQVNEYLAPRRDELVEQELPLAFELEFLERGARVRIHAIYDIDGLKRRHHLEDDDDHDEIRWDAPDEAPDERELKLLRAERQQEVRRRSRELERADMMDFLHQRLGPRG